jgi:pimeloyl-ACP methyl ester carboxylesterase
VSDPEPIGVHFVRSADGARIAYASVGAGSPALILVHGWSCDRCYWDGQLARLSREFQVVTIDLAGHGDSDRHRQEWTIESFGDDVASVANHLALDDVVLVGHSMGGDVILAAATKLPGRVRGLVWVDTYGKLPHLRTHDEVHQRMAPFRADFVESTRAFVRTLFGPCSDPLLVERIARDMSDAPVAVALAAMEAAWTFAARVPTLLAELRLPLVAINPDNADTDVESLRRFEIEVALLPGSGHFPMLEDSQAFNDQLVKAVTTLSAHREHATRSAG